MRPTTSGAAVRVKELLPSAVGVDDGNNGKVFYAVGDLLIFRFSVFVKLGKLRNRIRFFIQINWNRCKLNKPFFTEQRSRTHTPKMPKKSQLAKTPLMASPPRETDKGNRGIFATSVACGFGWWKNSGLCVCFCSSRIDPQLWRNEVQKFKCSFSGQNLRNISLIKRRIWMGYYVFVDSVVIYCEPILDLYLFFEYRSLLKLRKCYGRNGYNAARLNPSIRDESRSTIFLSM